MGEINLRAVQPKTLEEASDYIFQNLDEEDRTAIAAGGGIQTFHHGFGTAISNEWGLWNGSELQTHFRERFGLGHADDMSSLILERVDALLNNRPFDPEPSVQWIKAFWEKQGVDPLTQESHDG